MPATASAVVIAGTGPCPPETFIAKNAVVSLARKTARQGADWTLADHQRICVPLRELADGMAAAVSRWRGGWARSAGLPPDAGPGLTLEAAADYVGVAHEKIGRVVRSLRAAGWDSPLMEPTVAGARFVFVASSAAIVVRQGLRDAAPRFPVMSAAGHVEYGRCLAAAVAGFGSVLLDEARLLRGAFAGVRLRPESPAGTAVVDRVTAAAEAAAQAFKDLQAFQDVLQEAVTRLG